jgi:hypothetical protein
MSNDTGRSVLLAIGVGLAIGLSVVAIVIAIVAIPLFALARFAEPERGLARPVIRDNLLHVAVPAGVIVGVLTGAVVGRWYKRGGRLPTE